jgi:hypothetical protein
MPGQLLGKIEANSNFNSTKPDNAYVVPTYVAIISSPTFVGM